MVDANIWNKPALSLGIKRAASWVVVALMLFSSFSFLLVVAPSNVSATPVVNCPEMTIDGTITYSSVGGGSWTSEDTYATADVGYYGGGVFTISRGYLALNLSSIPVGVVITSASLHLCTGPFYVGESTGSFRLDKGDFGDSLTTADWGCGRDNGTYAATFVTPTEESWITVPIPTSLVTGSRLELEMSLVTESPPDCLAILFMAEHGLGDNPYLEVTYSQGSVPITYELFGGTTSVQGVVPEVSQLNATYDCYQFEFDTWELVDNVSIAKTSSDWSLLSYTPYANSTTETSSSFNLTGVIKSVTYRVYFVVPSQSKSSIYLALYFSISGLGVPWGSFSVRYSSGTTYNNSNDTFVTVNPFGVDYGNNYTVAVFDWFGNEISNITFVSSSLSVVVSIPIKITEAYFQFSDGRMHRFLIETGGNSLNFSSSPLLLYYSLNYNMTVYEDQYIYTVPAFSLTLTSDASQIINVNVTEKYNPTTVYFRYFDGTGTHPGEGLEWERYLLYVNGTFCPFDWYATYNGTTLQVTVDDFFGNILYNQSLLINTAPQYLLNISINTYSFKFMNSQDYDPIKVKIWYEGAGSPHEFYLGAKEVVERFVKAGNYTIQIVFYNQTGSFPASVFFTKEVTNNATYFNVYGASDIEQLIENAMSGVIQYVKVITTMITPDVVSLSWMMPQVPGENPNEVIYIHPYSVITADTLTTNNYGGDLANFMGSVNLTGIQFYVPHGDDPGVTYTTIKDRLWVTQIDRGNVGGFLPYDISPIFVLSNPFDMTSAIENLTTYITTGTLASVPSYLLYYAMNATSFVDLNCQNITVVTLYNVTCSRESTFRAEQLFYYNYYTATKQYTATLTINNSLGYEDWNNVYWYIGFPDNRTINTQSVSVYDLDNALYLKSGTNYEVTSSGIRMYFPALNSTIARSFTFSFYDTNATGPTGIPIVTVDAYTITQHNSESFLTFPVSWTNPYAQTYTGQLQIKMTFKDAEHIEPNSIEIFDKISNRYLTSNEFSYAGNTITISQVTAGIGVVSGYDVYFKINVKEAQNVGLFTELINILGIPISIIMVLLVALIILVVWAVVISDEPWSKRIWKLLVIAAYGSFVLVVIMLHYMGGIP